VNLNWLGDAKGSRAVTPEYCGVASEIGANTAGKRIRILPSPIGDDDRDRNDTEGNDDDSAYESSFSHA